MLIELIFVLHAADNLFDCVLNLFYELLLLLYYFPLFIYAFDNRLKLLNFRIAACTGGSKFVLVNQIGHIKVNQISPLALNFLNLLLQL